MDNLIETILYKNIKINIWQDMNDTDIQDFMDENLFLTAYHSDFTVTSKIISKQECVALASDNEDEEVNNDRYKELKKQYHVFGLEAYIHGGIILAISQEGNFVDRRWDVSQLGLVFVAKNEQKNRVKAKKLAEGLIKTINDIESGNVYGYTTEPETESCWEYIGEYEDSGIIKDAKSAIDYYIEKRKKENAKKLKAKILNNVPLEKRKAFCL